jgi:hypothetical protein
LAKDPQYVDDILTKEESELLSFARSGDWFTVEGWDRYGEDWPDHIPRTPGGYPLINLAAEWLFGWQFQDYQVHLYYCPIADRMLHGGRGSGKSTAIAIAHALRAIFAPGHNWLHVAPSIEQSRVMFQHLLRAGRQANFNRVFLQHYRTAPAPDIELRPWDKHDPGTKFFFRSIGGHGGSPMELLRSLEAGFVSADEAFRVFTNDYFVRILTGIARGPNEYKLNAQPELRSQYDELIHELQTEPNPFRKKERQEELTRFIKEHQVAKQTTLTLTGNAGPWAWEWLRYKRGLENPGKRWSATWTSDMNAYFTEPQKELLIQQFEGDEEGLRVEMNAERPRAVGDVFAQEHIDSLFDPDLDEEALLAIEEDQKGWEYMTYPDWGLVKYQKPAEKNAAYAAGADPGTGRVPRRNKWVNLVARIDKRPFEIVYFNCGNKSRRGQGSIRPWIQDAQTILNTYPMPEAHFAAEASGTQKDVHEITWIDELRIVPLTMTAQKPTLVMKAQLMLQAGLFVCPQRAQMFEVELASYQLNDKKLDQDFVMAFLALVAVIWPYVSDEFQLVEEDEGEEEEFWYDYSYGRESRSLNREVRVR